MKILSFVVLAVAAFAVVDGLGIAGNKEADYKEVLLGLGVGVFALGFMGKLS